MILYNRRIPIREVADDDGISFGSCQAIFADVLGMKRAAPTSHDIAQETFLRRSTTIQI